MRLVKSLSEAAALRLVAARKVRPFSSVQELAERAALDRGDLEALAAAGAFAALSGNRHLAFWEVAGTERLPPGLAATDTSHPPGKPVRGVLELGARTGHSAEGQPLLPAPTEGIAPQRIRASAHSALATRILDVGEGWRELPIRRRLASAIWRG